MSLQRPVLCALVAAALSAAACGPRSEPGAVSPTAEASSPIAAAESPAPATPPAPADLNARLVAYAWRIESATDARGKAIADLFAKPDSPLGLAFRDGRLSVEGGCNRQSFAYALLDAGQLKLGPGMGTLMACPPPLAAADAAIARFLTGTLRVSVAGAPDAPTLQLLAADGSAMRFTGTPTPETRFGGPGTLEFFEVLPQRGPCEEPPASERRCLLVRARHFDENGIATRTPGEFRPLQEEIEGYAPTAGEQQVVRVRRFQQDAVAGGEPKLHYVLDLVIESRVVSAPGGA